jgi:hypothetical protein
MPEPTYTLTMLEVLRAHQDDGLVRFRERLNDLSDLDCCP